MFYKQEQERNKKAEKAHSPESTVDYPPPLQNASVKKDVIQEKKIEHPLLS